MICKEDSSLNRNLNKNKNKQIQQNISLNQIAPQETVNQNLLHEQKPKFTLSLKKFDKG
jgi:hypothetical protein